MEAISLGYCHEHMVNDNFVGLVRVGLGVAVYKVTNVAGFQAQLFPVNNKHAFEYFDPLFSNYIEHVVELAKSADIKRAMEVFPYFNSIEDLLTLRCLIEEAANEWSMTHGTDTQGCVSRDETDTTAGEALE